MCHDAPKQHAGLSFRKACQPNQAAELKQIRNRSRSPLCNCRRTKRYQLIRDLRWQGRFLPDHVRQQLSPPELQARLQNLPYMLACAAADLEELLCARALCDAAAPARSWFSHHCCLGRKCHADAAACTRSSDSIRLLIPAYPVRIVLRELQPAADDGAAHRLQGVHEPQRRRRRHGPHPGKCIDLSAVPYSSDLGTSGRPPHSLCIVSKPAPHGQGFMLLRTACHA